MHSDPGPVSDLPFGGAGTGTVLGPLTFTVSRAANERYWRSAGVDHPLLEAGALYPPIAANLTILLFQTVAPRPLLQTAQRLVCHRSAPSGQELSVRGVLTDRFAKRSREYAVVAAEVVLGDATTLWTSIATFCEVQ